MLATFRYALLKAARVKSTWFMLLVAVGLLIGIAGVMPFRFNLNRFVTSDAAAKQMISVFISYAIGMATIVTINIAVFAGVRGASLLRDEAEDGTLLIMLSKPITRSTLILAKWAAYVLVLTIFCFLISAAHGFGIGVGSKFSVSSVLIVKGIFLEWAFGVVFALIFSGLALFFSTFLSATHTAVTVIVFGVLGPLTTVVQPLVSVPEYELPPGQQRSLLNFAVYNRTDPKTGEVKTESPDEFLMRIKEGANASLTDTSTQAEQKKGALFDFLQLLGENGLIDRTPAKVTDLTPEYGSEIDRFFSTGYREVVDSTRWAPLKLYRFLLNSLYVPSPESNPYLGIRFLDFSAQATSLTRFVTDTVFSPSQLENFGYLTNGSFSFQRSRMVPDTKVSADMFIRAFDDMTAFSPPVLGTTSAAEPDLVKQNITKFFASQGGVAYTVRFEDYIDKRFVVIAYVLIGLAFAPLSLVMWRRKDIR